MVIPDVIISWPKSCDYPLYRKFLIDNRIQFNEVLIVITETHQEPDYTKVIRASLEPYHIQFITPPATPPGEDWRHIAVTQALIHSYNAEWVWFTEQDYMPSGCDPCYFKEWHEAESKGYEIMAHYEADRLHPASIVIKRSLLNKTRKQFGIIPNKADHFYKLQEDIEALQSPVWKLGNARHLNGLSHNMSLIERGEAPNYQVEILNDYLIKSLKCDIEKDPRWEMTFRRYISRIIPANDHSPTPPLTFDRKIEAKSSERETPRAGE